MELKVNKTVRSQSYKMVGGREGVTGEKDSSLRVITLSS